MKLKPFAWMISAALMGGSLGAPAADERFVTIGTGGQTGVYYVAGQSICRFVNRSAANLKCNAPASGGGVANVNGLRNGDYNFGVMQSDHQFKALKGLEPFAVSGPMETLRAVFSLQSEVFTVLARQDANISSFEDLKGKRVNIGNLGSGQRNTLEEILAVKGWDDSVFKLAAELKPTELARALSDNNIDAITYFVGHPNDAIQEAATQVDAVFVSVSDEDIDQLLAEKPYYTKANVPGGMYRGNDKPTPSLGGKAVLSTTTTTDAEVVYQLVKAVFENIDHFKRLDPAFKDLAPQEMIDVGLSAPLHDGALRYYKERGWM